MRELCTSSALENLCQPVHAVKASEYSGWTSVVNAVILPLSVFTYVLKRQVQSPS